MRWVTALASTHSMATAGTTALVEKASMQVFDQLTAKRGELPALPTERRLLFFALALAERLDRLLTKRNRKRKSKRGGLPLNLEYYGRTSSYVPSQKDRQKGSALDIGHLSINKAIKGETVIEQNLLNGNLSGILARRG
jgi:hypothetical protein